MTTTLKDIENLALHNPVIAHGFSLFVRGDLPLEGALMEIIKSLALQNETLEGLLKDFVSRSVSPPITITITDLNKFSQADLADYIESVNTLAKRIEHLRARNREG